MVQRNFIREFMELTLKVVFTTFIVCIFGLMVILFA